MSAAIDAFELPEPNEWPRNWARIVLGMLIAMGVIGWACASDAGFWLKAGMCGVTLVIEGWGFIAAVQWSRAMKRQGVAGPLLYWAAVVIGCAAWTIFSIYHALGLVAGDASQQTGMGALAAPAYVAFTALALSLPFHEWAIERVETAAKKAVKAAKTIEPEAETNEPQPIQMPNRGAARSVARELMRQAPRNASKRRGGMSETRTATRAPPLSEEALRQAVAELTEQGKLISLRGVAKHLDVPVSRVERSPAKGVLYAA